MKTDFKLTFDSIQVTAAKDGRSICLRINKALTNKERDRLLLYIIKNLIANKIDGNGTATIISLSPIPNTKPYIELCEVTARGLDELFSIPKKPRKRSKPQKLVLKKTESERKKREKDLLWQKLNKKVTSLPNINQKVWEKIRMKNALIGNLVGKTKFSLREKGATLNTINRITKSLESMGLSLGMETMGWSKTEK